MYRSHALGADMMDVQATPATPPTVSPALTGKYRRNGKLQSCEPCRKSKLRCDHTVPVCGRCIKRRCVDLCVYHPNPLSQSRKTPTPGASIPTPSASCTTTHDSPDDIIQSIEPSVEQHYFSVSHGGAAPQTPQPQPRIIDPPVHSHAHRAASAPPLDTRIHEAAVHANHSQNFFGATSYPSIFSEGLGNIDDMPAIPVRHTMTVSPDRIARGCEILTFLRKKYMVNQLVSRWYEICAEESGAICSEPIMKEWLKGVWAHHDNALAFQNPEKLRRLSELIWKNTQTPVNFNGNTTAMEYARMATGHNLRWEVVGLIATNLGLFATTIDPSDSTLTLHKTTRQDLVKGMLNVSEECLSFCRECASFNDMFAWLLIENSGLMNTVTGDASFPTYRVTGEMINFVISMGWHQGAHPSPSLPLFLADLRNKFTAATYSIDVSSAAFLGRPPRMSYRYCNFVLPLDLADHQLTLEGAELAAALAELDENGNNTTGRISRMTYYRAVFGLYPRREDIIDLALAEYSREEVLARAEIIQRKTEEFWANAPTALGDARHGPIDLQKLNPIEALQRSAIKQGYRANDLLLQRVLIRKAGASPEKLIQLALLIFRDILTLTQRHDLSSVFKSDVTEILVVHGLRSAAILAVELLKQEQLPVYPLKPLVPRSQTIQDLSVFASRLDTIDPSDGAYSVCQQGRKLVTRILDKILAPKMSPHLVAHEQQKSGHMELDHSEEFQAQNHGLQESLSQPHAIEPGYTFDAQLGLGNDMDFMQWLQNTDMEQADVWNTF